MKTIKLIIFFAALLFYTKATVAQEDNCIIIAQKIKEAECFSKRSLAALDNLSEADSLTMDKSSTRSVTSIIGAQVGLHSPGLATQGNSKFDSGIFIEAYLKFLLSNEIYLVIDFTYWSSHTDEINTPIEYIPSESIIAKGLKLDLDFTVVKIPGASLSLGPSVSIEKITNTASAVFSFGANFKLNIPLWDDKINMISTFGYRNGTEALNFGGGTRYSFFYYLLGLEYKI